MTVGLGIRLLRATSLPFARTATHGGHAEAGRILRAGGRGAGVGGPAAVGDLVRARHVSADGSSTSSRTRRSARRSYRSTRWGGDEARNEGCGPSRRDGKPHRIREKHVIPMALT
jgi:hypothetical protein